LTVKFTSDEDDEDSEKNEKKFYIQANSVSLFNGKKTAKRNKKNTILKKLIRSHLGSP